MVRLNSKKLRRTILLLLGFNSKMVRLNYKLKLDRFACIVMFQFQNGTIKLMLICKNYSLYNCFNSKMVRLNFYAFLVINPFSACFNSKMVRLNSKTALKYWHKTKPFQFQNGTIKFLIYHYKL